MAAVVIARAGQTPILLHPPTDRALASLWELAELEVDARDGHAPVTQADWAAVTARYHALIAERRADLGAVIREVRAPTATILHRPVPIQLRTWLTAFGEQIAAVLPREVDGVHVVSPADAVEPMRHILRRLGSSDARAARQAEQPAAFIRQWTNSESAIVLTTDAEGPKELRFVTRIASDAVKIAYRLGSAPATTAVLMAVAWELGIRRIVAEFHQDQAPNRWMRSGGIPALSERRVTPRGDGWYDQVVTLLRRPDRAPD